MSCRQALPLATTLFPTFGIWTSMLYSKRSFANTATFSITRRFPRLWPPKRRPKTKARVTTSTLSITFTSSAWNVAPNGSTEHGGQCVERVRLSQLMNDKIWKAAAAPIRAKCEADNTEFAPSMVPLPVKYDATFASKNSVNGHVIGVIVSSMITADSTEKGGNIIRTLAQKNIDERARLRAEALASAESGGADDALAAMMAAPPATESTAAK